jgi:hypothetical protein
MRLAATAAAVGSLSRLHRGVCPVSAEEEAEGVTKEQNQAATDQANQPIRPPF